jgi:hypothetical protein
MPRFRNREGDVERRAIRRRNLFITNNNLFNKMEQLRDNLNRLNQRNLTMSEVMFVRNARESAENRGYTNLVGWNAKKTLIKFKEAFNNVRATVTERRRQTAEAAAAAARTPTVKPIYTAVVNKNNNSKKLGVAYNNNMKPVPVINP